MFQLHRLLQRNTDRAKRKKIVTYGRHLSLPVAHFLFFKDRKRFWFSPGRLWLVPPPRPKVVLLSSVFPLSLSFSLFAFLFLLHHPCSLSRLLLLLLLLQQQHAQRSRGSYLLVSFIEELGHNFSFFFPFFFSLLLSVDVIIWNNTAARVDIGLSLRE